jgi:predicted phage tail protein|tara:strand:+ start:6159 stop:6836 length:678 start_codon:yes stop_codon:yes gene_type:complete
MKEEVNKVKVRFHGNLGKRLRRKVWNLSIGSVQEALHAVNILSGKKLIKMMIKDSEKKLKYQIKVDDKPVETSGIDYENLATIGDTELCLKRKIKKIDIIPVLEGSGDDAKGYIMVMVAIILIVAGIYLTPGNPILGPMMISAGVALLAGGVSILMAKPPKFDDFRNIETANAPSYLFSGPVNSSNEGGPVPLGYGRLLCGSQTIQVSLNVRQMKSSELGTYRPS